MLYTVLKVRRLDALIITATDATDRVANSVCLVTQTIVAYLEILSSIVQKFVNCMFYQVFVLYSLMIVSTRRVYCWLQSGQSR